MQKITLLASLVLLPLLSAGQTDGAIYTVIFESNWSQEAHPHSSGSLPVDAHWSRFVGVTHNADVQFVSIGTLASTGIENVAEQGNNTAFFTEVDAAITAGNAFEPISGGILDSALGNLEMADFQVSIDYPLISAVSMIAPSPDWMIAIDGISLIDGDGQWIVEQTIDVYAYDAGTDSGSDYNSPNMNTDPQDLISSLQGVAPFSSEKIGTVKIMLNELLNVSENQSDNISISPNPAVDIFRIEAPNNALQDVSIYSAIGQRVKHKKLNGVQDVNIEISDLKSGIYLVQLTTTDNRSLVRKLVKQ